MNLIRRNHHTSTSFHSHRRALTLIELLIALAITSVTCGILAVLINATAAGTNVQNDGRRGLVRMQSLKAGLEDEFANAQAILATGSNYVVYWMGDQAGAATPANYAVNLSELRLLEVDTATGNLYVYAMAFPTNWSASTLIAADLTCSAATSWYSTCNTLKTSSSYFSHTTVASGVTGMTIALDSATPTSAKIINIRIDTTDNGVARQLVLATALANPMAPY